jgi:hypothetical protein
MGEKAGKREGGEAGRLESQNAFSVAASQLPGLLAFQQSLNSDFRAGTHETQPRPLCR